MNRRIGRIEGTEAVYTVYNGDNAWVDFDETGAVIARYLYGGEIDEIVARYRPGEDIVWYLTDHLGSVRDIIDNNGAPSGEKHFIFYFFPVVYTHYLFLLPFLKSIYNTV